MFIDFIFPDDHLQIKEVFIGNSHQIVHETIKKTADVITEHLSRTNKK